MNHKGRERIRPQIGSLTFLKIFLLEMIFSGRSQHSEPMGLIIFMSVFFSLYVNDLYTIPMLTNSSIINIAHIDLQNNWTYLIGVEFKSSFRSSNNFEYLFINILKKTK